jgi:hypothetical protein
MLFQRLRRRDIGGDHHLLDEPHCLEPLRDAHVGDHALAVEDDLAFGQVEVKRPPLVAGAHHRLVGAPQGLEDRLQQGAGGIVGPAVDRLLRLAVAEFGG